MKRVLVACGNGIATSTVVASKVREVCENEGLDVSVTQCKLLEIDSKASDYDLVITTGKFNGGEINVPIIGAMALLTGIGEEEKLEEIVNALR